MIWDFIRDFFVQFIFGGRDSSGRLYSGSLGRLYVNGSTSATDMNTSNFPVSYGNHIMSMGDWLSTTATIICMCLIVFLLICLVRWIFRVVSSAFLLK